MNAPPAATAARKSPTAEDLRIWRDFIETGDHLRSLLEARFQSESDLSSGDYSVLLALSEADGRQMRSSQLAEQIDWERSRLSHHLGRMEARGLLRREKCASDNRGAEVLLTDEGASRFRRASAPHLRAVRELFIDGLSPELLAKVEEVTTSLRLHLASLEKD